MEISRPGCHDSREVSLTFWWSTHHCCLVSMATVTSDKHSAPALTQGVLVTATTQALIVEEAGSGAELGVLQRRANVTENNNDITPSLTAKVSHTPPQRWTRGLCFHPTPNPAACRSRWHLGPSSGSCTPPPTGRSGRPRPARCQRMSYQPAVQRLKNKRGCHSG